LLDAAKDYSNNTIQTSWMYFKGIS
jgi:hypothetical protein